MDSRNVIAKWANCCRLCLLDDGIKLPIFEGEGIQKQVAHKIQTCFPILIYVGDPLPKMICHKCLCKLDIVYDFRHKCLEANAALKRQLLTLMHMAEVKQYLDCLESSSGLRMEVTQKPLLPDPAPSVMKQMKTSQPVVPNSKNPVTEDKMGSSQIGSSSENMFQEVFLADCSTDLFFSEQTPDETVQANENESNVTKPPSREKTVFTAPTNFERSGPANSPADSAVTSPAITIKQEPDETVKDHSEVPVTSKSSPSLTQPRNNTEPNANWGPVSVQRVKQEKMDTAAVECLKCKIRFQGERQLQEHVCTVVSQWTCEHCSKYFKTKDTLYKHKKYFCPKKRPNCVCRRCGKVFSSVTEMAQHQKFHLRVNVSLQEESLYTCTACGKKFAARSMFEMHKKSHHSGNLNMNKTERFSIQPKLSQGKVLIKPLKCQYCPKSYSRKDYLKVHLKTHHAEEKNSSVPERSMETRQANKSDKDNDAVSQRPKKCNCNYCGRVYDDSGALWLHMVQQHSSEKAYKCDKCDRSFDHLKAYSNHKRIHGAKMCCTVCKKRYSSSKALREHEYYKHTIQKTVHQCRVCSQSFATRSALLIHGREHYTKGKSSAPLLEDSQMKIRTLPCSLCSKRFPSTITLVAHMQTHIGMDMNRDKGNGNMGSSSYNKEEEHYPSLTCKICFRLFSSKGGLQRHIKIHATGKHVFYPCKICGKKFVSEATYKTHAAAHVVSESFHCPQCNKIFFKEEVFKNHMCENTGKDVCLTCGVRLTEEQHTNHVCDGSILKSSDLSVKCSVCSAVFSSIKARNNHMRIHGNQSMPVTDLPSDVKNVLSRMGSGLYKCNICSKLMMTQQSAAGHARWHYHPNPVKAYSCPFCNRKYTTETGLYTHIAVEHPDVPG